VALNLPTDEVFLTTEEVLAYLQVNLRTVYRLIKAGKIPAVRVGRQWRFRKRDIDAWLDSQRTQSGGAVPSVLVRHGRARILVVDDEASIRDLLAKTLALAEYDVDTAPDAATDGLTLVRQVKGIRAELPVIIITGFSSETSAIEAVNLGVAGYLRKPFRVPEVLAAAAKALGVPAA